MLKNTEMEIKISACRVGAGSFFTGEQRSSVRPDLVAGGTDVFPDGVGHIGTGGISAHDLIQPVGRNCRRPL